mgnify:CR=1 FL=1
MVTIYDKNGGKYKFKGNYLLPRLTIGSICKNESGIWGQKINNICNRATEFVNKQVIYN